MIEEKYQSHTKGMKIFGDATSQKEDAKLEKGQNFFTIAAGLLRRFNPENWVPRANPNSKVRCDFVNNIFKSNIYCLRVKISRRCNKFIEDLQNTMEAQDEKGSRLDVKIRKHQ